MRTKWIAASLLFCIVEVVATLQASAFAQATQSSSDYTAALPSVEKVKAQLKGTDPTDTVARRVAVFTYLQTYITRIVYARHYGGPFTAGEQKLMGDYAQAAYQLSQDFTRTHTPAEVKSFQQVEGTYEVMNALDWIKQLQGQQAADTYKGTEASLAQSYKQHEERLQQQMKQDQGGGRSSIAGDPVLDPTGMFARAEANRVNDPELRRCLELGASLEACEGVGAIQGMASILVPFAEKPNANEPPPAAGVVFVGDYQGRSGLASINFGSDLGGAPVAIVRDCGSLVTTVFDGHEYTLRKSGGTVQLVLANEPNPIVITLQPDGSISGPGSVLVKGRIVTGYTTTTKTVMVDGAPAGPQGYYCNGPCSTSSSIPNYAPKIERCTLGSMAFTASKPAAVPKTGIGFVDATTTSAPIVTGFRMVGRYLDNAGLTLEFQNDGVILDCGKAHAKSPYVVENGPAGFVVRVQNGGGAFLLNVAPDNTLRGSGTTSVNGKLVASIRGDMVNFTPHSESCNVGTFVARSKRNTMRASSGPIPAAPPDNSSTAASAVTPMAQPASSAASVEAADRAGDRTSDQRTAFRVLLDSSFSGANPLAGQTVFVMRKSIGSVLRELGVAVPANAGPGEAMKSLQTLCHSPQGCTSAVQGMSRYYVTATKLDASGRAMLSAHTETGTYFFFAIVPSSGGSLVWDIAANLAAGDNNVVFSTENAQQIH
ncbi:hypothetical protein [Terriglobus albidus]|uniref:hypothetical protein n=1 Tax=Terriglobus albidus TaxID=1592106 RepID=UPI0021DF635E|nr:hypothetical protein [Terriglobus albidus]